MNLAWKFAEGISYESGFEFEDRLGVTRNKDVKRTLAAEVGQHFLVTDHDFKVLTFSEV